MIDIGVGVVVDSGAVACCIVGKDCSSASGGTPCSNQVTMAIGEVGVCSNLWIVMGPIVVSKLMAKAVVAKSTRFLSN